MMLASQVLHPFKACCMKDMPQSFFIMPDSATGSNSVNSVSVSTLGLELNLIAASCFCYGL